MKMDRDLADDVDLDDTDTLPKPLSSADTKQTTAEPEDTEEGGKERLSWQQQLAKTAERQADTEEGDGDDRGVLVAEDSLDRGAHEISNSPEFQAEFEEPDSLADPAKYSLPQKFVEIATAADRPLIEGFIGIMAESRTGQEISDRILEMVADHQIARRQALFDADVEHKEQMETILRSEWGDDAQERLEELSTFIKELPGQLGAAMMDARTSDGRRLIDHPEFPLVMSDLVRGNGSPQSNATERLAKINSILKRDPARYFRDKLDEEAIKLRRQTGIERTSEEVAGNAPVSG
jgi:hypothetical protein